MVYLRKTITDRKFLYLLLSFELVVKSHNVELYQLSVFTLYKAQFY